MCLVPDFRILGEQMLRQWFQKLPIQALSATCPPAVQDDIIKILRLKPMVDGTAARPNVIRQRSVDKTINMDSSQLDRPRLRGSRRGAKK